MRHFNKTLDRGADDYHVAQNEAHELQKAVIANPYNKEKLLKLIGYLKIIEESSDCFKYWKKYSDLFSLNAKQFEEYYDIATGSFKLEDGHYEAESRKHEFFHRMKSYYPFVNFYRKYMAVLTSDYAVDNCQSEDSFENGHGSNSKDISYGADLKLSGYDGDEIWQIIDEVIQNTQYDFLKSGKVWRDVTEFFNKILGYADDSASQMCSKMKQLYLDRLSIPHNGIEETFSSFSKFISDNFKDQYDKILPEANKIYEKTKKDQLDIEMLELKRDSYEDQADFWIDYLDFWATKPKKQRKLEPITAVFLRAVEESIGDGDGDNYQFKNTRKKNSDGYDDSGDEYGYDYNDRKDDRNDGDKSGISYFKEDCDSAYYNVNIDPEYLKIWLKYIYILYENQAPESFILQVLQRFVRHYPESAISYAELFKNLDQQPDATTIYKSVKDRINATKLLEESAYDDWSVLASSILTFEHKRVVAGDVDFAEPLYTDLDNFFNYALENCQNVYHAVERQAATIAEQLEEIDMSREYLKKITTKFGSEAENWLMAHNFERRHHDYQSSSKILRAAITRAASLDWPERIFEEAQLYEKVYGTVESCRAIRVKISKKASEIKAIREQAVENMEAASQVVEQEPQQNIDEPNTKRKADEEVDDQETPKKQKTEPHRDREHLTISVKQIPKNITEKQVLMFFKACGEVRDTHMLNGTEYNGGQSQLNIEFADEQAVLRALTKDHKRFHGSELRVERAFNTVIFVTNFAPGSPEDELSFLFGRFGDITSIRFPSLRFNSQRRFCYIEYSTSKGAKAALSYNGFDHKGYKLVVKLSDPESKQSRTGAHEEGREVHITNLDFYRVTTEKVKLLFEKYGTIERVFLPQSEQNKNQNKKHNGFGFVTFATAEEARASLELNLVSFEGRVIEVSISKKKSELSKIKESQALDAFKNSDKIIALWGIPDSVTPAAISKCCEYTGKVKQVILEPEYQGAIIEFENSSDAAKASLRLNNSDPHLMFGSAYDKEKSITVGTIQDMKASKSATPKVTTPLTKKPFVPSSLRRRQVMQKPKVIPAAKEVSENAETPAAELKPSTESTNTTTARSNDDFRALFLAGKK